MTVLSLVANAVLAAAKVIAGILCNSQAILVDGLHTGSDLATDAAVLAGLRVSSQPADQLHHYGHQRAMTLVTALLGLALLGVAAYVAVQALIALREKAVRHIEPALPLALAILTVVVKEAMYRMTLTVGRRAGDSSVVANAWHHRSDAFSSVAAAAGLAGVAVGGPQWHFLDHLAALILTSFLLAVAWPIVRDATGELMDRAPDQEELRRIESAVRATRGVRSFHAFRARRVGGKVEMDIHVQVDPALSVRAGHDIASQVRSRVQEAHPDVLSVIVHVEPAEN